MEQNNIARHFGVLNRQTQNYINMFFNHIDLSFSEYIFLVSLYDNEGINQEELSSLLFIDKAATARDIKLLEEKEFLIRKICEEDKRAKRIYLTDKGRNYKEYISSPIKKWLKYITEGMDKETIDIVIKGIVFMEERAKNADFDEILELKNGNNNNQLL